MATVSGQGGIPSGTLSASEIAGYARQAGVTKGIPSTIAIHGSYGPATRDNLAIATAIALAESGGNPNAHCLNCAGVQEDSRGLWQINVDAHPQYASENLYDPAVNAAAMFQVSGGGVNWHPWSTFTSGAYLAYMPEATAAANGQPYTPPNGGPTKGSSLNPLSGIASAFSSFSTAFAWLTTPANWLRVGEFALGGVLVIFAVLHLFGLSPKDAVKAASIA